jgi:hypothetical protein
MERRACHLPRPQPSATKSIASTRRGKPDSTHGDMPSSLRVRECRQGGRLVTSASVRYVSSRPPGMLLRRTCRYHHREGASQNTKDTNHSPAQPATTVGRIEGGSSHAPANTAVRGTVQLVMSSHAMASNRQTNTPIIPGTRVTNSPVIGQWVPTRPATTATPTTKMTVSRWDRSNHRAGSNFTSPSSLPRTFAVGVRDEKLDHPNVATHVRQ